MKSPQSITHGAACNAMLMSAKTRDDKQQSGIDLYFFIISDNDLTVPGAELHVIPQNLLFATTMTDPRN